MFKPRPYRWICPRCSRRTSSLYDVCWHCYKKEKVADELWRNSGRNRRDLTNRTDNQTKEEK